ncbi:hypothetical protein NDU88_001806 [Pleurodeles waltl]|uniref:Uncharacterized protein n=1 Tax=Pleurodeles waltl TaxID=8319 RepID=A0AAV7Q463_PLEWA|nr:hypothetical protein NDU88_001806 [Pleurodeles waltl]
MFAALPVELPQMFFREVDDILQTLYWGTLRHCMALQELRFPVAYGGLAPDFKLYYSAAKLQWVACWRFELWDRVSTHERGLPSKELLTSVLLKPVPASMM